MKSSLFRILSVATALCLVGCQPKSTDVAELAETIVVGPEYSANKGLYLPEDTRRSLGLKLAEVREQRIASSLEISFHIYEVTGSAVRASGLVSTEQAKALKAGQPMEIHCAGGEALPSAIFALHTATQQATGAVEVIVQMAPSAKLTAGTFVTGKVVTDTSDSVTSVPRSALVQSTEGYFVYTVSGNRFVRTPVKLGALGADLAEVKEGLYTGDQVVSEAAMALWMTELAAVKGGHACCAVPAKGK